MSQTVLKLGFVPIDRGEYDSSAKYYKDNIVQYSNSSYIADPVGYDPAHPESAYNTGVAPLVNNVLQTGWRVFASGNNKFTTGESVDELGIDEVPIAGSNNLVKSGGVKAGLDAINLYLGEEVNITDSIELAKGYIANNGTMTYDSSWEYGVVLVKANQTITVDPQSIGAYPSLAIAQSGTVEIGDVVTVIPGKTYTAESDTWIVVNTGNHLNSAIISSRDNIYKDADDVPMPGSVNFVESGGVRLELARITKVTLDDFCNYGAYYSSDGSYNGETTARRLTGFFPVSAGDKLHYKIFCNSNTLMIAAFDSSKAIMLASSVAGTTDIAEGDYTVPSGVSYVRFCEGGDLTRTGEVVFDKSVENVGKVFDLETEVTNIKKLYNGVNILNTPFVSDKCVLLYVRTNFNVTKFELVRLYNQSDGFRCWVNVYENSHSSTAWTPHLTDTNAPVSGFHEATITYGPSVVKVGLYMMGEINYYPSTPLEIPLDNVIQEDIDPVDKDWQLGNDIGNVFANENPLNIRWKEGRLDWRNGTYNGWTNSADYINSGIFKLPAGNYKLTSWSNVTGAPAVLKFNNDYTFNSVLVEGGSGSVVTNTFTLAEDTLVALNTHNSYLQDFRFVKINSERFSEVDNKLYYKGQPIASESSLSAVVTDLPVGDGTGIQSGYAYIDSTDRTIKVKA